MRRVIHLVSKSALGLTLVGLISLSLMGCNSSLDEVMDFVGDTKANAKPPKIELPEPAVFEHYSYQSSNLPSPFESPKIKQDNTAKHVPKNCLTPDVTRRKQQLENFAIESLTMKGILDSRQKRWGLVEAPNHQVYKVKVGDHIGVFDGEITAITKRNITFKELVPSGDGCYEYRDNFIALVNAG